MTTANEYNEALVRVAELEVQAAEQAVRIAGLDEKVVRVSRIGVQRISDLEARNAKLEQLADAAIRMRAAFSASHKSAMVSAMCDFLNALAALGNE